MSAPAASQPPSKSGPASGPLTVFLSGVQFLLLSPAFIKRPFTPQELGGATAYYPLVGVILGGVLIGLDWLLSWFLPLEVRSALLLAAWVFLTGALHLDGFLDSCDGLLGGFTPEQRLEIMRDERVGAYALAGGVLLLLSEYSALNALGELRPLGLLLAPALGRWALTLSIGAFSYARPQGLGSDIKDQVRPAHLLAASLWLALIVGAAALAAHSLAPLAALLAGAATWRLGASFILRRIPGLTGDSYGALCTLVELTALLSLAAFG